MHSKIYSHFTFYNDYWKITIQLGKLKKQKNIWMDLVQLT